MVRFTLANTGHVAGAEVAQLYLKFPDAAGEPPKQLKGFRKVQLSPGETKTVEIALLSRDVSTWDVGTHGWRRVSGHFEVLVGSSSRDIRLNATFTA